MSGWKATSLLEPRMLAAVAAVASLSVTMALVVMSLPTESRILRKSRSGHPISETSTSAPYPADPLDRPLLSAEGSILPHPIHDAATAIAVTQSSIAMKTGLEPGRGEARLLTGLTLDEFWFDGEKTAWEDTGAYWLVGVLVPELTVEALFPMPPSISASLYSGPSRPIDGAFAVWHAGSGYSVSEGALSTDPLHNFSRLADHPGEAVPIIDSTPISVEPF